MAPLKTVWEKEKMLATSIFSIMLLPFLKQISIFQEHIFCRLQILSNWTSLKLCHLVKSEHKYDTATTNIPTLGLSL